MKRSYKTWEKEFQFSTDIAELEQLLPIDNEEEAMRLYEERIHSRKSQKEEVTSPIGRTRPPVKRKPHIQTTRMANPIKPVNQKKSVRLPGEYSQKASAVKTRRTNHNTHKTASQPNQQETSSELYEDNQIMAQHPQRKLHTLSARRRTCRKEDGRGDGQEKQA